MDTITDPMRGFRYWRGTEKGIYSVHNPVLWKPQEKFTAQCSNRSHKHDDKEVPVSSCSCGVYAFKDKQALNCHEFLGLVELDREGKTKYFEVTIPGALSLWGNVHVHSRGYKGQYAYPYEFYVPDIMLKFVRSALTPYGIDIVTCQTENLQILDAQKDKVCPGCDRCNQYEVKVYAATILDTWWNMRYIEFEVMKPR